MEGMGAEQDIDGILLADPQPEEERNLDGFPFGANHLKLKS
jgi:hypothetical protein